MAQKKSRQQRSRARAEPPNGTSGPLPPLRPLEINEETRWKARVFLGGNDLASIAAHETPDARDARLLLLLLNKLTPTMFDKQVDRFLLHASSLESDEGISNLALAIITRAADDARFSAMHATLCGRLVASQSCLDLGKADILRETLIRLCLSVLSRDPLEDGEPRPEGDLEHPEERELRLSLARRNFVGTSRFLGELYNSSVVSTSTLLETVDALLPEPSVLLGLFQELRVEGLVALLDAGGRKLDKEPSSAAQVEPRWAALALLVRPRSEEPGQPKLCSRIRFLIDDLLTLRSDGWIPTGVIARRRREELVAKPLQRFHAAAVTDGHVRRERRSKKSGKKVKFRKS